MIKLRTEFTNKLLSVKPRDQYPESEYSSIQRKERNREEYSEGLHPSLLDIIQSNSMASRTAVILLADFQDK